MAKKRHLSNEVKYSVADIMSANLKHLNTVQRNVAFGVVINTQIRVNGKMTTLKEAFSEEDAIHITNLVLRRISNNKIIVVDVNLIDDDDEGEDAPF